MALVYFQKKKETLPDGTVVEKYYDDLGSGGGHLATTWEVALDEEFTKIIDASYFDTVNLTEWHTPLPIPNQPGEYFTSLEHVYVRARIFCGNIPKGFQILDTDKDLEICKKCDDTFKSTDPLAGTVSYSPWSPVAIGTQRYQQVRITEEGKEDIITDSKTIGWKYEGELTND